MHKLKLKIDHLRKKLRWREHDRRSSSPLLGDGSVKSKDYSYFHRSRTPSTESFSTSSHQDKLEKGKFKNGQGSSHHSMGNNAMSKALHQISKSFVRRINKARLPHHFSQPTFTIYNGRSDSTHSRGFVRTPAQWKNHMKNPTEIPNKKPNEN